MSRVLVTGASGFVGQQLLQRLLDAGEDVHALSSRPAPLRGDRSVHWHKGDLLDPTSIGPALAEVRPERLVHLAWYVSHGAFWSAVENVEWVEASLRLLRAFAGAGGRRALIVGSCAEYEWGGRDDLDEQDSELRPASLYGVCKDGLRRVAAAYALEAGFELAWGRLFFLYGPHEQPDRLVPAVIRALLAGERIATTAGTQVRDFMHVDDVAAALAAVLSSDVSGAVNIGTGRAASIGDVLDLIGELTGAGELIERGARPTAPAEPARIVASVERLSQQVGFRSQVALEQGLASTIEWWRGRATATRPGEQ